MSQSLNSLLADAVVACAVANDNLALKRSLLALASNAETDAINKVNETQKAFDELVALVKKEAPINTDWRNITRVSYPVGEKT